ncbi:MAG: hypothetical protein ACOCYZ_05830 [Halococcoides sp.]
MRWHRWIERTDNLLTLSVLVVLPVLIGGVTLLANHEPALPFLLFPPLASGGYSLFADPGRWRRDVLGFVGGLSLGAASGWLALEVATTIWYEAPATDIHAGAVALGVLMTALVTLAVDIQAPATFSTALLVHVSGPGGVEPVGYVTSVIVGSLIVAGAYVVWRHGLYDRRAGLLYESIQADDQVLVPVYGETPTATAMLGARLAGAHDAGRVVLCGLVDGAAPPTHPTAAAGSVDAVAGDLERTAERAIERLISAFDRPIETRVAVADLEAFLDASASQYDLVVVGASRDRSLPSRILSPPTYRRLAGIDTDLAIVGRNYS